MKIIKFILIGILTISVSCTEDEIESLGRTDCDVEFTNRLNDLEDAFQDRLGLPDSEGNQQSLENCLRKRELTYSYILDIENISIALDNAEGCSADEKNEFRERMGNRTALLLMDIRDVWSHCEEIYGGG